MKTISPRQITFVKSLTEQVEAAPEPAEALVPVIERLLAPVTSLIPGCLDGSATMADASRVIDALQTIVKLVPPPAPTLTDDQAKLVTWGLTQPAGGAAHDIATKAGERPLSEKQWGYLGDLFNRANATATAKVEVVEGGLYVRDNGTIVRVKRSANSGRLYGMVLAEGWTYGGAKVLADIDHALTEEEARAFGHKHHTCINCGRDLDTNISRAQGYGPVCAKRLGWRILSEAEAVAALQAKGEIVNL